MTYKLFLDTNILLDNMLERRPDGDAACELMRLSERGDVLCTVSATSLNDVYYVSRRFMTEEQRRGWLAFFLDAFDVAAPTADVCRRALASDEPDFEDGIIRALAEAWGASYIISRDERAFTSSPIPRVSAGEFLELVGESTRPPQR